MQGQLNKMRRFLKNIFSFLLPFFSEWLRYNKTKIGRTSYLQFLKIQLLGNKTYWYCHPHCTVANSRKISVGLNCLIGRPGCYIQGAGNVFIGNYVQFGPNVGVLSSDHDLYDQRIYNNQTIKIGDYSWVGMNSIITAGVELGPRTVVAAGAVVTKSFPDGFCVLAGVPAKVVRYLDKEKFVPWHEEEEWYGYYSKEKFEKIKRKYIDL